MTDLAAQPPPLLVLSYDPTIDGLIMRRATDNQPGCLRIEQHWFSPSQWERIQQAATPRPWRGVLDS